MLDQELHLALGDRRREWHEEVRVTKVALVFRDLVFGDEVVTEGVPRKFRDRAVVLVLVVTAVGEHHVRATTGFSASNASLMSAPRYGK